MAGIAADPPRGRPPVRAFGLMGDDRLSRLASDGEVLAFEAIYRRYHQVLYRYCRSLLGNAEDAADALQSTMASALRALNGERREIALKPWLFRIAHNECVSMLRKRRPQAGIDAAEELEAPSDDPAVRQRLRELVADMRQLPDAQRGALVMRELSGLAYRDVASALGTTEPHARQLVYEARTALHDLAEGRDMECDPVRRSISDGDGRVLRGRRIRAHLRACADCRGFEAVMTQRRSDLAAIAPPLPAALAAAVLHKALGGGATTAGTAAAASAGGAGGGLGTVLAGKAVAGSLVAKVAAVVAATAVAGGGAVEIAHRVSGTSPPVRPGSRSAAPHSAAKPQPSAVPAPAPATAGATTGTGQGKHSQTSHGKSGASHGRSNQSHGKSGQSHRRSHQSHGKSAAPTHAPPKSVNQHAHSGQPKSAAPKHSASTGKSHATMPPKPQPVPPKAAAPRQKSTTPPVTPTLPEQSRGGKKIDPPEPPTG
jgi:RNA polymerase sigma factor (sigma-70 family)